LLLLFCACLKIIIPPPLTGDLTLFHHYGMSFLTALSYLPNFTLKQLVADALDAEQCRGDVTE
jgi:hypothetical protein